MNRFAKVALVLGGLMLLLLKLLSDVFRGASDSLKPSLADDAINLVWPFYSYARASIASGELPLWNPHSAVGTPFVADLVLGMFYPLNWIIFTAEVPDALLIIQFLTVVIGMVGMYCYTRYLQFAWPARILSIALFAYAVFTEAFHPALGSSFCWIPMLLWLTHRYFDAPGYVTALCITLVLALCFLAGFPNFFLYTCMVLFVYGAVLMMCSWRRYGVAGIASRVFMLVPALLLMVGLVAVQLLPSYELSTHSVRAVESGTAYQSESGLENFSLLLMIRNYFLTDIAYLYANSSIRIPSGIYYLGGTLLLLPFAFASRKYRAVSGALLACLIFMALFVVSNQVPALSFLQKIPLADSLRIHGRGIAYIQFVLIMLASVGLSVLCERTAASPAAVSRRNTLLRIALFLAYAAALEIFALEILENKWFFVSFVLGTLLIAVVLWRGAGSFGAIRCCWIIALVILIDVSVHRNNHFLVPAFAQDEGRFVTSNLKFARSIADSYRVLFVPGREGRAYHIANVGPKYQVPNISAYSSLGLARWERFIRYLVGEEDFDNIMSKSVNERFYGAFIPSLQELLLREPRILELASLRYWFYRDHTVENKNALPRAYAVRNYIQAKDEAESLAAIKANLASLGNTVILEDAQPSFPPAPSPREGRRADVSITFDSANRVELDVDVVEASIVVLTDAFYPGWEAYVDDRLAPIYRANSLFRAVEVPPGRHRISFRFRPNSLFWGMVISLASAGLMVGLFLRAAVRRRHGHRISAV